MSQPPCFDLVIVGGGIAGLWTLAAARAQGHKAILLESNTLGGGQSISSQGIIHGGSKYALSGKLTRATTKISDMPATWQQALNGEGAIDLSSVTQLCDTQYMLPSSGIDTKVLSFFGSKTMSSHTTTVKARDLPESYRTLGINNNIFRLNELVLDTQSLFRAFQQQYGECIYQCRYNSDLLSASGNSDFPHKLALNGETINTRHLLLACGEGFDQTGQPEPEMQIRPLQMVIAKGRQLPAIYAHFIGRSSKPLLTITSHPTDEGTVWYMGGGIAEDGVGKTPEQLVTDSKALLSKLAPAIDIDQLRFATHNINRAEPKQSGLVRPDDAYVELTDNGVIVGWPTKLALAPRFAEKALALLAQPAANTTEQPLNLPKPTVADYPWNAL